MEGWNAGDICKDNGSSCSKTPMKWSVTWIHWSLVMMMHIVLVVWAKQAIKDVALAIYKWPTLMMQTKNRSWGTWWMLKSARKEEKRRISWHPPHFEASIFGDTLTAKWSEKEQQPPDTLDSTARNQSFIIIIIF